MISLLLLTLLIAPNPSLSAKNQASPVYEVVNEQARIDDRIRISSNPGLPYGNPLAGKQNARLHFNNQQAMFNAERMRQLAAQLQRQARGPKLIDSYMQAYHESQDNHQLALEQQQANIQKDKVKDRDEYIRPNLQRETKNRDEYIRPSPQRETKDRDEYIRSNPQRETIKSRDEYVTDHPRKSENPQSTYGLKTRTESRRTQRTEPIRESVRKNQRTETREPSRRTRPEMMRITKADAKDVRYRNHRSYGSVDYQQYLEPQRYKTVYLSPGPTYDQGVTIKPNGNIGVAHETKTKLLTEAIPSDIKYVYPKQYHQMQDYKSIQEIQANSLIKNQELPEYSLSDTNDTPFDYYFYLKDPSQSLPQSYDQYRYAQLANTYTNGYTTPLPTTDYKPITEDVDDIEDPNAKNPQAFTPLPTPLPTVPTKSIPIKTVPSLHTVPTHYKTQELNHIYTFDEGIKQEETPVAQAVHYYQPYYEDKEENKYLHTNVETTGVQHLTEDGSITAYGNDNNVSKNTTSRYKRSNLDNEPFSIGESTEETPDDTPDVIQDKSTSIPSELPTPEPLIRLTKRRNHRYRTGPIIDNYDDELYIPVKVKNHELEASFEEDYSDYDDTDYSTTNINPVINVDTTYVTPKIQRGPVLYSPPATSYGYPINYSPIQKIPSNLHMLNSLSSLQDVLEPVYMITKSQLKELMGRNLNIEHLDVYQLSNPNKVKIPTHFPRRYKKRNSQRYRNYKIKNKLHKLGKLLN